MRVAVFPREKKPLEALAEKVLSEGDAAKERYLALLRSGGSDYPVELLRAAGVDLTTDAPYDLAMRVMNEALDDVERLVAKPQ